MTARQLPDTVTVFGVEARLYGTKDYTSTDEDGCATSDAEVRRSLAKEEWFATVTRGQLLIEGPWAPSPEEAAKALEDAVRKLVEGTR